MIEIQYSPDESTIYNIESDTPEEALQVLEGMLRLTSTTIEVSPQKELFDASIFDKSNPDQRLAADAFNATQFFPEPLVATFTPPQSKPLAQESASWYAIQKNLAIAENRVRELESELLECKSAHSQLAREVQSFHDERAKLRDQLQQSVADGKLLRQAIDVLKDEKKLEVDLSFVRQENAALKQMTHQLEESIKFVNEGKRDAELQISKLRNELNSAQIAYRNENEFAQLNVDKKNEFEKMAADLTVRLKEESQSAELANQELERVRRQNEQLGARLGTKQRECIEEKQKLDGTTKVIATLTGQLNAANDCAIKLQKERDSFKELHEMKSNEILKLSNDLSAQLHKNSFKTQRIEELQRLYQETCEQRDRMSATIDRLSMRAETAEQKAASLDANSGMEELEQAIEIRDHETSDSELRHSRKTVQELREIIQIKNRLIEELEAAHKTSQMAVSNIGQMNAILSQDKVAWEERAKKAEENPVLNIKKAGTRVFLRIPQQSAWSGYRSELLTIVDVDAIQNTISVEQK